MHLIEDNKVNKVVFVSSFVFLFVFVSLTASDEWTRDDIKPAKVDESGSSAMDGADIEALRIATPEAVERGKGLFAAQCSACHGANGAGDGPAAAALQPPPRDFTSGVWKLGGTPVQVFKTISEGSPGTSMPPFSGLSAEDRFALAHFVRSLSPNKPEDTPATLQEVGVGGEKENAKSEASIPIRYVMQLMAEESGPNGVTLGHYGSSENVPGATLYQSQCMGCHGAGGEGGRPIRRIGVNPYTYVKTRPFTKTSSAILDRSQFVFTVSEGLPGHSKPSYAQFNPEEWDLLYQYVQALAK